MIRGVIFDCFGVLYTESLKVLRSLCPSDKVQDLLDLNKQKDYGFISEQDYERGVALLLGKPEQDVHDLLRQVRVRNDSLIKWMWQLREQYPALKIALLSNVGTDTIERLFTERELSELFDVQVLSYQEHLAKPHPEIFTLTATRLGLPADECVMIDDREENCDGAEIAGMQSILFTENSQVESQVTDLLEQPSHA